MTQKKMHICFSTILGNTSWEAKSQIATYNNFFSALYASNLPVSMHFTDSFLKLLQNKSQAFDDVAKILLNKKQIELIGGAFYSPLLPFLNTVDIVGQVELYTTNLRKLFSIRTKIAYIPSSAWIPSLVSSLKKTGNIEHCLIDRRLFEANNLEPHTPVCLEDAGKVINAIPFLQMSDVEKSPEEFFAELEAESSTLNENNILVIFLPYMVLSRLLQREIAESWFDRFLQLVNGSETLEVSTILKSIKSIKLGIRGFIEANVIQEGELKNASPKNLISKNSYAYRLYQKLMYTSLLINQIRGDKQKKTTALLLLWKAQSADVFLKAAFSPDKYRATIFEFYKTLLLAEKTTRTSSSFLPSLVPYDIRLCGQRDYISQTKNVNAYINVQGGYIFEYDFLPANKNYCVLPFAESGLFIDRVLYNENPLSSFQFEEGKKLPEAVQYQLSDYSSIKKTLVFNSERCENQIALRKQFSFNGDSISVQYILKNETQQRAQGCFVCELDMALGKLGNNIPSLTLYANNEKIECPLELSTITELDWVQINDAEGKTKLTVTSNEKVNLTVVPILSKDLVVVAAHFYVHWYFDLNSRGELEKLLTMVAERSVQKK